MGLVKSVAIMLLLTIGCVISPISKPVSENEIVVQETTCEEKEIIAVEEVTVEPEIEEYISVWTTANLNIRKEPSIESEKMGLYEWATKIDVAYFDDEWAKIKDSGYYVNRNYLSEHEINPADYYTEVKAKITAYCPCYPCSGIYGDSTALGKKAREGRTIAVDPNKIPYGTEVVIDGNTYIAEDCGGDVTGWHIDIYFDTHEEVDSFGLKYKTVRILKK